MRFTGRNEIMMLTDQENAVGAVASLMAERVACPGKEAILGPAVSPSPLESPEP